VNPPVTEPSHAVFLSYASQDAEAAHKICEALRAAGIEVFLDQSELRGGDAWDQKIRHEIHDCVLFIPIVSQHTQERLEGYFRHEWKLAIERTHHMADQKTFLVPVVIDGTRDQEAVVPDAFRHVQWTRLPAGETPPEFVTRIQKLLSGGESGPLPTMARGSVAVTAGRSSHLKPTVLAVVLAGVAAYLVVEKPWTVKLVAFAPPPHSIAVLPFVNMSGDKEQEYFSDGLTEELLNSLAEVNELQVAARTSAFSFKGKDTDIGTIARKLNVETVLEGGVRRSGNTVRITTQLINAATGFHLWSKTYDRDLGDVLKLQTEIATAVAEALKITLLGDISAKIELGGTRNPAAFDAYLRASKLYWAWQSAKDEQAAIDTYTEAIGLDPNYALAYAARSIAHGGFAENWATTETAIRANLDNAQVDARKAIALAADLSEGHLALALVYARTPDFTRAAQEYERALALGPSNARVLKTSGIFAVYMGHDDAGLAALRRAVALDPLNSNPRYWLALALRLLRHYDEAVAAFRDAQTLAPNDLSWNAEIGITYYLMGDFQDARSFCEKKAEVQFQVDTQHCLAMTYDKLGRRADAEAMLAKLRAYAGESGALSYTEIYAQWGDPSQALTWLETALRLRDPGLYSTKADPLLYPLRKEPRFQAIERELKFP
jgi:TolB-like protein/Tfp pilus assembly protein PilF